jgi:hypothetical protein
MSDRIVRNPTFVIRNYLAYKLLPLEKKNQKLLSPLVSASQEPQVRSFAFLNNWH